MEKVWTAPWQSSTSLVCTHQGPLQGIKSTSGRFHSRTFVVVVVVDMPLRNYLLAAKYPGNHSKYNPQSFMIQLSRLQ